MNDVMLLKRIIVLLVIALVVFVVRDFIKQQTIETQSDSIRISEEYIDSLEESLELKQQEVDLLEQQLGEQSDTGDDEPQNVELPELYFVSA